MSDAQKALTMRVPIDKLGDDFYFRMLVRNAENDYASMPASWKSEIDQNLLDWKSYGKYKGFPGFAVGTNYVPQDMLAQIHEGEAIIPAPFNPERYNRASGNDALVAEIKALRAEVESLRKSNEAGQNAIAANTRKTAQTLTKFDIDGLPESRT